MSDWELPWTVNGLDPWVGWVQLLSEPRQGGCVSVLVRASNQMLLDETERCPGARIFDTTDIERPTERSWMAADSGPVDGKNPITSYEIPWNPVKSHKIPLNLIKSHKIPLFIGLQWVSTIRLVQDFASAVTWCRSIHDALCVVRSLVKKKAQHVSWMCPPVDMENPRETLGKP